MKGWLMSFLRSWGRGKARPALYFVLGLSVAITAGVVAQQSSTAASSGADCSMLLQAQREQLKYRLGMLKAMSPDSQPFYSDAASGCLGGLALSVIDFSKFTWSSKGFMDKAAEAAAAAWETAKNAALSKGCYLAQEQLAPMVDTYNEYAQVSSGSSAAGVLLTAGAGYAEGGSGYSWGSYMTETVQSGTGSSGATYTTIGGGSKDYTSSAVAGGAFTAGSTTLLADNGQSSDEMVKASSNQKSAEIQSQEADALVKAAEANYQMVMNSGGKIDPARKQQAEQQLNQAKARQQIAQGNYQQATKDYQQAEKKTMGSVSVASPQDAAKTSSSNSSTSSGTTGSGVF